MIFGWLLGSRLIDLQSQNMTVCGEDDGGEEGHAAFVVAVCDTSPVLQTA